jgi:adenylate cyclase
MYRLNITFPDGKRALVTLSKPLTALGRGSANDVILPDPSVSRLHAVLKAENDKLTIADRGSTNGVYLNGKRISSEAEVTAKDTLRLGAYTITIDQVKGETLMVQRAEMIQMVDQVLKGETPDLSLRRSGVMRPDTSRTELLSTINRLENENYLLRVLFDSGKALHAKLSLEDIASQTMELSFRIQGVERGFMLLFDEQGAARETEVKYRRAPVAGTEQQIILSQTIVDQVRKEQQPLLITDVSLDERFAASQSVKISGLRSAMCAPLLGSQRLLGLLYVDNNQRSAAFTQDELNVFSLVAAQAAAALDSALAHQQLAQSAIQRSALERFLAPEVVELITQDPEGMRLGGRNQKVSVMFADIRGFTTLSESMPPEQIVEILNSYFTHVTDVIFDHGGTLDKYIGDAVMALFGAPISKGVDAINAVRAAVDLQKMVTQLNRDAAARKWPELQVGIGINTGIVTAGNIGSPRRFDYTVIGDSVNTASRLMSKATGGQIIISQSTAEELTGEFALHPLEPLQVKGKARLVPAFEVRW